MRLRRDLRWPSLAILATGLLSVAPIGIIAQTSTAVCLSTFGWMNNTRGQSPCTVGAYLQGACNGGQFNVLPLPPNTHYTGPYANQQNECQCSTVTYNMISACGLCQGASIIGWSVWDTNCSNTYPGVFPAGIPDGTAVPAWAFQDVTQSDQFNATLAQSVGDSPEATATSSRSFVTTATASTVPTTPGTSASLTALPSTSNTSSSTSSNSGAKAGAIAGGVVGGVAGVALIAGVVVFFLMKRKRSQVPPLAQRGDQLMPSSPDYTETASSPFALQVPVTQPKIYDPSDPSTFPTSPPPTTLASGSVNNAPSFTNDPSSLSVYPGYYSGAPEV